MGESPLQACALLLMSIPENSEAAIVMDKAVRRIGYPIIAPVRVVHKIGFEHCIKKTGDSGRRLFRYHAQRRILRSNKIPGNPMQKINAGMFLSLAHAYA
jgi:hypothetical protein